ncbi:Cupredoxin-like domain protein [uncultured archaeon]|nr:Cupredoxin-like domain protein [uncultured archaeon]
MSKKSLVSLTIMAAIMATVLVLSLPVLAEQANSSSNAKDASILIQNSAFFPTHLTVEKGTTVTWLNADYDIHKIKGDNFESNDLNRGDSFSYKFDAAGTYSFADAANPSIKGEITVT